MIHPIDLDINESDLAEFPQSNNVLTLNVRRDDGSIAKFFVRLQKKGKRIAMQADSFHKDKNVDKVVSGQFIHFQ